MGGGGMGRGGMGGGRMMAEASPPTDEGNEKPSIFLSQEQLGGRKMKVGETLTLTVRDVDPETGGVQADLSGGGETSTTPGYEEAFNEAVPEEEV